MGDWTFDCPYCGHITDVFPEGGDPIEEFGELLQEDAATVECDYCERSLAVEVHTIRTFSVDKMESDFLNDIDDEVTHG